MTKKKTNTWQFKVSFALSILMLFLILGYFTESFLEIRKVKPVTVAKERIMDSRANQGLDEPTTDKE